MGGFNIIPGATLGGAPIALPNYSTLDRAVPAPSEQQLSVSAANAPIPFGYGPMRIGAKILNVLTDSTGALLIDCLIGEGPLSALTGVEINEAAAPAGVTWTFYDGTQASYDAALAAAFALQGIVFNDIRPGVSYVVLKFAAGLDLPIDERSIGFLVNQRKIYDSRGYAVLCDGVNDFVNVPDSASLHLGTGSETFECWVSILSYPPTTKVTSVMSKGGGTGRTWIYLDGTTNKLAFNNFFGGGLDFYITPSSAPSAGAHHVALVVDRANNLQSAYIDGVLVGTNNISAASAVAFDAVSALTFGGTISVGIYANIIVDEARIWSVARSQADILDYMNKRALGTETGLVACWHFDEGTGTTAADATSNGNTGTLTNGPLWNPYLVGLKPATVAAQTSQAVYSANPALALADFLSNATIGPGDTLDWASVATLADRCDELLSGSKRNTLGVLCDEQRPKAEIEEALRAAAGCFVVREGPTTYLVADAPVTLSATPQLAAADWMPESLRYEQRGQGAAPNRITVRYTNTTVKPWAEAYTDPIETADVTAGTVDAVEMVVNAPWIQKLAEAVRLRNRYFYEHTLGLKTATFEVFEKFYRYRRGDVIRLTDGVSFTDKPFRILKMRALGFARGQIVAQEYDATMYPNDTPADPSTPTATLQDPRTVLPVTALTMAEEVYLDQSQGATVATGAKYLSRFRVTWTRSADAYLLDNGIKFMVGTSPVFEGFGLGTEYVSPPVQQGQAYTVEVRARNSLGFLSAVATKSATAAGKLLVPGDVPRISQAIELGGEVLLAWDPAVDIDVIRYEWRYTPNTTGSNWAAATFIDRVDSLRARFKGLPVGTHRFYVKAIDSVGNNSTNAAYVDITVTSDANAFLQALEYTNPTLTNMIAFRVEGETWNRWISNRVGSWDSLFPSTMSTYTNPIATYGTGDSTWIGETIDIGTLVTGNWSLDLSLTDLSGTAVKYIQTSPDGSTWTDQAGLSYTGASRYVRPKVTSTGAFTITRPPRISLSAVTRKESGGPVTSNSGSAKTISLAGKYVKAVRITVTPLGTVARMPTVDNVVLSLSGANTFDVYLFDQAGTQVASDFRWDFEGF